MCIRDLCVCMNPVSKSSVWCEAEFLWNMFMPMNSIVSDISCDCWLPDLSCFPPAAVLDCAAVTACSPVPGSTSSEHLMYVIQGIKRLHTSFH